MKFNIILTAVATGIGATLLTDLWNIFLRLGFKIQSLNFCLLGRWILYMPTGKFRHNNLKATSPKSFECLIGWLAHYSIGAGFAIFFIIIISADWFKQPTLVPALLYGIGTVIFPLFVMQPAFGLGFASSNTPKPVQAISKSIMTHIIFGVGLWLCATVLKFTLY
jgi:hypothetical protein